MLEFQEKRKIKRLLYSRLTIVVLLLLLLVLLRGVWGVFQKERFTRSNLEKVSGRLDDLKAREAMLSNEIDHLKTTQGTEEEIREKYGLIKPGEEVITIVDKTSVRPELVYQQEDGWWQKLLNWLK